jgi:hypothetical protein
MARRRGRVDGNQAKIVAGLRTIGAGVCSVAGVGDGFGDLVVGFRGRNYLLECKDPGQPPSKRRLTPKEETFHAEWPGQIAIVETVEEAIEVVMNG